MNVHIHLHNYQYRMFTGLTRAAACISDSPLPPTSANVGVLEPRMLISPSLLCHSRSGLGVHHEISESCVEECQGKAALWRKVEGRAAECGQSTSKKPR